MKEAILNYSVDCGSIDDSVNQIEIRLMQSTESFKNKATCLWLACFNPHSYVIADNDQEFSEALHGADWLVPDGIGVLLASRILGGQIRERVTGSDVFYGLQSRLNAIGGLSVFFLGSTEETLTVIRQKMSSDYPNIRIAGTYSPPFKSEYSIAELDDMIDKINASKVDVLWVSMTAPKQEKWIFQNKDKLNVRFAAAVGAVFDFYAGNIKRSHPLFQRLGLEWLPRLLQEPRRLWRRMGVSAPIFLYHTVLTKIKRLPRKNPVDW